MSYDISQLYEDAYNLKYEWEEWLHEDIYEFHDTLFKEFNAPIPLQMGTLLPFISALAGPSCKGHWSTRPNVINFFSINIAASGVGKSQCRKKLVAEPLTYMLANVANKENFPDMEVNKFTRAGEYTNWIIMSSKSE